MVITSTTLRRISTMPAEAMAETLLFLAEQLEAQERKRAFAAERQSRWRNAQKDAGVTPMLRESNGIVTPSRVLDNISKPSLEVVRKEESITSDSFPQDPPGFKDFWAIYPPRAGDRDRKPATKAFAAALKRVDLKTLLAGTERYAADCKAKGKINTEYVKQARTWLNADGWNETYETAPSSDFSSTRDFLQRIGRA